MSRTENKNDDKLFEFLNSNIPSSKERKPVKPKVLVDSSSEVVAKPTETVEVVQTDAADGQLNEGELGCKLIFAPFLCITKLYLKVTTVALICRLNLASVS